MIGPALTLVVLWAVTLTHGPTADTSISDLGLYHNYSDLLGAGQWPYRDFQLEYPPLSLVPFRLGSLAGASHYELVFGVLMLLATLVTLVAVGALAGERRQVAMWAVAVSPPVVSALARTHFDAFAVALGLGGLWAVARAKPKLGFAILGAGAMVKLFPALAVPVALAWLAGRGQARAAVKGAVAFAVVVVACSAPFLGRGYLDSYRFQLERPIQIESTPAVVVHLLGGAHTTGPFTAHPDRFRSQGLRGGASVAVAGLFTGLLIAALCLATLAAARDPTERGLLMASCAAVLAFVALGKVASPQFAVWLIPWAALALAWRERLLAALLVAALVLTQIEFPRRYFDLVAGHPGPWAIVAARDLALVLALGVIAARLAGSWRSTRPALARSR